MPVACGGDMVARQCVRLDMARCRFCSVVAFECRSYIYKLLINPIKKDPRGLPLMLMLSLMLSMSLFLPLLMVLNP